MTLNAFLGQVCEACDGGEASHVLFVCRNAECTSSKYGTCFALHEKCMKHKMPDGGVGYQAYCAACAPQPLGPRDLLMEICDEFRDEQIPDINNGTTREERAKKRKRPL